VANPTFDGSMPVTPVGYFTYTVEDDQWFWSDGIYDLHGYEPRSVEPSTELLLRHKHPDDRARAYEVLETVVQDGRPFSCYHRLIDAKERVRSVLSVGRGVRGDRGTVEQVLGFFVDLTAVRRDETNREVEEALLRIAEHRSTIEQAKGIVMLATGCDPDRAFEVLREASTNGNVKLRHVAHGLVEAVGEGLAAEEATRAMVLDLMHDRSGEDRR